MWKGSCETVGVEQARQDDVHGVNGSAGDAVNAVQSRQPLADNSESFHRVNGVFGGA